jgi:hypothetical protein
MRFTAFKALLDLPPGGYLFPYNIDHICPYSQDVPRNKTNANWTFIQNLNILLRKRDDSDLSSPPPGLDRGKSRNTNRMSEIGEHNN